MTGGPATGTPGAPTTDAAKRRLLVVGDSDSYVKWGAALASTLPGEWTSRLVVVASPVQPSERQLEHALDGTRFAPADARILPLEGPAGIHGLDDELDAFDPHAVLLALRGPFVRVIAPRLLRRRDRPVLVSGFPGLTIPAVPKAVIYREQTDLIVLHSRREVREFRANAAELGVDRMFGLATLPFLSAGDGSTDATAPGGTDVIFAAQAKVPVGEDARMLVLSALAELARRRPDRRVVVKVRARAGEAQTHEEAHDYADLMGDLGAAGGLPPNLVVEDGPMAAHLERAGALVTVSSTAALESIALGLPTLLLDDFGVSPSMINTVFEGAGLFGSTEDLAAGRFRLAEASWLGENYFHGRDADDWATRLSALVEAREIVPLPPLDRRHDLSGGALRSAFERRRMLGEHDRSLSGALAWGVGVPARGVVRRVRRTRRRLARLLAGVPAGGAEPVAPDGSAEAGSADVGRVPGGVREVRLGVAPDAGLLVGGQLAPDLARHAGDEGAGRHDGALEHHGAGRDE
ncbi:hypothetical protein GCM10017608_33710 [Agromyces luteolus]|nr:hypothetical protein GCM10017608_33710 [Agromyces luteolus]